MPFQFEAALSNYGLETEETEGTVRPQVDYGVVSAKRLVLGPQGPVLF